jgi:hypothetical protein
MKKDLRTLHSRSFATIAMAVIAVILAACSDGAVPSAPAAARSAAPEIVDALARANAIAFSFPESYIAQGLLREKPLARAVTVKQVIKSGGGHIDVPGTDFRLEIPKGAFSAASTTFTVTALPGSAVAYNFEPHGAQFRVPLKFVQKLDHTNLRGLKLPPGFQPEIGGAYFADAGMIDPVTGIAVVSEMMPADIVATWSGKELSFPIWHFSGYMASTGRSMR